MLFSIIAPRWTSLVILLTSLSNSPWTTQIILHPTTWSGLLRMIFEIHVAHWVSLSFRGNWFDTHSHCSSKHHWLSIWMMVMVLRFQLLSRWSRMLSPHWTTPSVLLENRFLRRMVIPGSCWSLVIIMMLLNELGLLDWWNALSVWKCGWLFNISNIRHRVLGTSSIEWSCLVWMTTSNLCRWNNHFLVARLSGRCTELRDHSIRNLWLSQFWILYFLFLYVWFITNKSLLRQN